MRSDRIALVVVIPACESCGRDEANHEYFEFYRHASDVSILERVEPMFAQVDGAFTKETAVVFEKWVARLVADPLEYAKVDTTPKSRELMGGPDARWVRYEWNDYGKTITELQNLAETCKKINGVIRVVGAED